MFAWMTMPPERLFTGFLYAFVPLPSILTTDRPMSISMFCATSHIQHFVGGRMHRHHSFTTQSYQGRIRTAYNQSHAISAVVVQMTPYQSAAPFSWEMYIICSSMTSTRHFPNLLMTYLSGLWFLGCSQRASRLPLNRETYRFSFEVGLILVSRQLWTCYLSQTYLDHNYSTCRGF
jgi:hypothetical protein